MFGLTNKKKSTIETSGGIATFTETRDNILIMQELINQAFIRRNQKFTEYQNLKKKVEDDTLFNDNLRKQAIETGDISILEGLKPLDTETLKKVLEKQHKELMVFDLGDSVLNPEEENTLKNLMQQETEIINTVAQEKLKLFVNKMAEANTLFEEFINQKKEIENLYKITNQRYKSSLKHDRLDQITDYFNLDEKRTFFTSYTTGKNGEILEFVEKGTRKSIHNTFDEIFVIREAEFSKRAFNDMTEWAKELIPVK